MSPSPSRRHVLTGAAALLASSACSGPSGPRAAPAPSPAAEAWQLTGDTTERDRAIASTWRFGQAANARAWEVLEAGCDHPLDAAEQGVHVTEADPSIGSVGLGGRPDANGVITLDASAMRGDTLACGSVGALENILHPVSVARAVMERSRHVFLVGPGALQFAREQGFPEQDLHTDGSRQAYARWLERQEKPGPEEDHDTIGMIVKDGPRLAMVVTTSGAGFKLPGRLGDSPIVGAGGYVDDEAGGCVATGLGEEVIRTCGSFAVVETLRRGATPAEATAEVVARIQRRLTEAGRSAHIGMVAMDRHGRVGGASTNPGFPYVVTDGTGTTVVDVPPLAERS